MKALLSPKGKALLSPKGKALLSPKGKALLNPKGKALLNPKGKALLNPKGKALLNPKGKALLIRIHSWFKKAYNTEKLGEEKIMVNSLIKVDLICNFCGHTHSRHLIKTRHKLPVCDHCGNRCMCCHLGNFSKSRSGINSGVVLNLNKSGQKLLLDLARESGCSTDELINTLLESEDRRRHHSVYRGTERLRFRCANQKCYIKEPKIVSQGS